MEHVTIEIARYRSPDGQPTCCANHQSGETCKFLGFRLFGQMAVCMFGANCDLYSVSGFIVPREQCEVWAPWE